MGITGLIVGLKQAKAQKKVAKQQIASQEKIYEAGQATREKYSQMVQAEQDIATQSVRAAEQARFNVMAALGAPGTYGTPDRPEGPFAYTPLGLKGVAQGGSDVLTSGRRVRKSGEVSGEDVRIGTTAQYKQSQKWEVEGQVLDPSKVSQEIMGTSGFRAMSKMVAESEQLVNKEGPLWDQLNNSITGGIFEGAAVSQRQMMEQLSREMAKGGTARNQGLRMAQAMRMQEDINRQRSGQLWQAKLSLEQWVKDNAMNVQNMSAAWVNNHAGIRDNYSNALTNMQTFWSKVMPANLMAAQSATQQTMANNVYNAGNNLMNAVNTKYSAIINGTNAIVGGITGSSMMSSMMG